MKKFLITFIASMLVIATCLLGCGCMPASTLEFTQNFAGNGSSFAQLGASYKETLTYDVSYETEYSSLKKDERIPQSVIPLYSGQYVSYFQASVTLPSSVQSNLEFQSEIHSLHTELDLTVTLKDGTVYQDKIITDSYFYSVGFSYAPIYAIQTYKQTILAYDTQTQNVRAVVAINQYETVYNKYSYTLTRKEHQSTDQAVLKNVGAISLHEQKTDLSIIDTTNYEYTPKTLIDNTQLIFGMRNVDATSSSSNKPNTVGPLPLIIELIAPDFNICSLICAMIGYSQRPMYSSRPSLYQTIASSLDSG